MFRSKLSLENNKNIIKAGQTNNWNYRPSWPLPQNFWCDPSLDKKTDTRDAMQKFCNKFHRHRMNLESTYYHGMYGAETTVNTATNCWLLRDEGHITDTYTYTHTITKSQTYMSLHTGAGRLLTLDYVTWCYMAPQNPTTTDVIYLHMVFLCDTARTYWTQTICFITTCWATLDSWIRHRFHSMNQALQNTSVTYFPISCSHLKHNPPCPYVTQLLTSDIGLLLPEKKKLFGKVWHHFFKHHLTTKI